MDLDQNLKFGPDVDLSSTTLKVNEAVHNKFFDAIKSYWPMVEKAKLKPDYVGLRPTIVKDDNTYRDFQIDLYTKQKLNLVSLHGIESPGLTSSLSLGKYISNLLL